MEDKLRTHIIILDKCIACGFNIAKNQLSNYFITQDKLEIYTCNNCTHKQLLYINANNEYYKYCPEKIRISYIDPLLFSEIINPYDLLLDIKKNILFDKQFDLKCQVYNNIYSTVYINYFNPLSFLYLLNRVGGLFIVNSEVCGPYLGNYYLNLKLSCDKRMWNHKLSDFHDKSIYDIIDGKKQ